MNDKNEEILSYKNAGVDYDNVDPFKVEAQQMARLVTETIKTPLGFKEMSFSRGESAFLIERDGEYYAFVVEGLGTKNLVADRMEELTGKCFYAAIAQDTVAMIVNDLITVGAMPVVINQHIDMGSDDFFQKNLKKSQGLVHGWAQACIDSGALWGGGETAVLKGMIDPNVITLSGSAFGYAKEKDIITESKIENSDQIIFISSSGIHANGLSMARKLADKLPKGYLTEVYEGKTFGELLLTPTNLYVSFLKQCFLHEIDIHYAVNITGHGWRKLMRAKRPFRYIVERGIGYNRPEFEFIREYGNISNQEMYGTFNMGAGFALYVKESDVQRVLDLGYVSKLNVWHAGHIEEVSNGEKEVIISELDIVFKSEAMKIR